MVAKSDPVHEDSGSHGPPLSIEYDSFAKSLPPMAHSQPLSRY
jgi:hypothetical protein